jgi:site-specific recombinase XerD
VPLVREQAAILREYMEENHLNNNNELTRPLFCNSRREKLTREGIAHVLKTSADKARNEDPGLIPERLSCHSLRHSRAMHLLQAGVNLVYIRDILGHVSIQTTEVYARADSKAKREALEKAYKISFPILIPTVNGNGIRICLNGSRGLNVDCFLCEVEMRSNNVTD